MPNQLTIQRPVEIEGVGLHTAVQSHLRLVPAPADTGIVFRRVDLENFQIEAHVRNVARVSYAPAELDARTGRADFFDDGAPARGALFTAA